MELSCKILALTAFTLVGCALCEAFKAQSDVVASIHKNPYPIAGPRIGKPQQTPKPEAPQSSVGYELKLPGFSSLASLQFASVPCSSLLVLAYSTTLPAFIWLSGSSRTTKMTRWYSAFNIGLICFAITLKILLSFGVFAILAVIVSISSAAIGILGFHHPNEAYVVCALWGSYLFTNLCHILLFTGEGNMYEGFGQMSFVIYMASIVVFIIYFLAEKKDRQNCQNILTAFTCSFAAVASLSFILSYFFAHESSPFDVISFMTYPTGFRWDDPQDVLLLLFWAVLTICGLAWCVYRDTVSSTSPGFGDDKNDSLTIATKIAKGGYERAAHSLSSISSESPILYFSRGKEASKASQKTAMENLLDYNGESENIEALSTFKESHLIISFEDKFNEKSSRDDIEFSGEKSIISTSSFNKGKETNDLWELNENEFNSLMMDGIEAY